MSLTFQNDPTLQALEESVISLGKEVTLDPQRSALAIVDMQVDYCAPTGQFAKQLNADVSPNQEIIDRLTQFAARFRAAGSPVIFTRMIEIPELMPENLARKILSYPNPLRLCDPKTDGFNYFGIHPVDGDYEIVKNTYNSFLSDASYQLLVNARIETARLEDIFQKHNTQHLVWTGVLTARCVQASLLGSVDRGYDNVLPFDLVSMPAGPLRVKHFSAISEMDILFAEVTRSDKISFGQKR